MARFISPLRNLIVYVNVNGKDKMIHFDNNHKSWQREGSFVTTNPELIEAIRKNHQFGKLFNEEKSEEDTEVVEEKKLDRQYPNVTRTQEANKVLVNEYGIDKETLKSKQDALDAAVRLNISFPNL